MSLRAYMKNSGAAVAAPEAPNPEVVESPVRATVAVATLATTPSRARGAASVKCYDEDEVVLAPAETPRPVREVPPAPVFDPTAVVCQDGPHVVSFTKVALHNGWMGNMSPHSIRVDGVTYRTSEALFHCLRFKNHPEVQEAIRAERSPMTAKRVAQSHMEKLTAEELSHDDEYMKFCLQQKISQHPELMDALYDTGDKIIVEDVTSRPRGKRWGAALEDGKWVGGNRLGSLWMEVRSELRA